MKEEDKLIRKVGTGNPFTVPEDYFQNLTSEVMNKLPEKENVEVVKEVRLWDRIKPWTYMAAMFVGAALIIKVAQYNPNPLQDKEIAATTEEYISDEYLDYSLNQAMFDDYSLYMYLSDATDNELN